jgi:chromate transport protein ChrA
MLIVWALVGFYIDRLKGMLVAGVVYMVVAPLIIFGVEKLFEFFKRKTKA